MGLQEYSRFIGRVGALAVALGVGVGFTTAMPVRAWADDGGSSSTSDTSSPNSTSDPSSTTAGTSDAAPTSPAQDATSTEPSESVAPSDSSAPADDASAVDAEPGTVQSSGGTHTGSYGPNATDPTSDDETLPTTAEASDASTPTDAGSTSISTPDMWLAPPQSLAPPEDSTASGNAAAPPSPSTTPTDVNPAADPTEVIKVGGPASAAVQDLGEYTNFRLLTASGSEDTGDSQLFTAMSAVDNSALRTTQNATLTTAQDPLQAVMAIPTTVVNIATGIVAAILSPFLSPGPATPTQPPLMLFAVLDWVRREIQRTFFNRSPHAVADVYTTSEDISLSGNVRTDGVDDTDADGDELMASLVTGPAHGDVTLNADGTFTYTPDANYHGADGFTYKITDETSAWHLHGVFGLFGGGHSDTATVTINVTPVNDAPFSVDDSATIAEDTQASGNLLTNDSDIDSNSLTAALGTAPTKGTAVLSANGSYTYTPNANFNGVDTFTYTVSDGTATDTGIVTVTVTPVPDAPNAVDDTATTAEDSGVMINVLGNDTDGDGDTVTILNYSQADHGSVAFNGSNSTLSYTPDFNYFGTDTFTYTISDGTSTDAATVTVTVNPVNDIAFSGGDNYTVAEDGTLTVVQPGVLGNDSDVDGDTLTAVLFSPPGNGTVELNPDGSFTYTPDADFSGSDSFEYYSYDGTTSGSLAFVNITVTAANDAVVARDDADVTTANTAATGNVLDNDTAENPDGTTESLSVTTVGTIATAQGGSVDIASDGTYTYSPALDFSGIDTFEYTVTDGATSDVGEVTITVNEVVVNVPPIAVDDELETDVDTPLIISREDLLGNDSDPDGDISQVFGQIIDQPTDGTLEFTMNGELVYTPNPGHTGTDSFTYQLNDGQDVSNIATVTITIGGVVANATPVAGWDSLSTPANTSISVTPEQLLANDFDADSDPLTITVTQEPDTGELNLHPDGSFTYIPPQGFTGQVTFFYTATDDHGNESVEAQGTIHVGSTTNTAPTATPDQLSTNTNTALTITHADLVDNDNDPEGDTMIAFQVSAPTNGTLEYNPNDDNYTYTPNPGFEGTDTFYYTAFDGEADSTPTTVTVTVGDAAQVNTAPVGTSDAFTVTNGSFKRGNVLVNDVDSDGDTLTAALVQGPAHGELTLNANGTFTYVPDAEFVGTDYITYVGPDAFAYTVSDGQFTSSPVTVSLTVAGGSIVGVWTPTPGNDSLATAVDTPLTITPDDLLTNDFDREGAQLSVAAYDPPTSGTLTLDPDGTFTYTPNAGFVGTDTFTYLAFDGTLDSAYAAVVRVAVGVQGNAAPTAVNNSFTTTVGTPVTFTSAALAADDIDPDNDQLSAGVLSEPIHGFLAGNFENGGITYTYTPDPGFTGIETLHYRVSDGEADSVPALVVINVTSGM